MDAILAVAAAVRTFAVLLSRKATVEAALAALVKRANRRNIPGVLAWTWGRAYADTATVPNVEPYEPPCPGAVLSPSGTTWTVPVTRVPLTLEGVTPRLNGWRFVATLQHLDGENIVRTLPGEEIPASYRNRGSVCEHCRVNRRRNDTYILRHDDGRMMQVGSSCIRDFLGGDDAAIIAAKAEILALAASVASDDGESMGGGGGASEHLISSFLSIVAWSIRTDGWVSRKMIIAQAERGEPTGTTTASRAWTLLTDSKAREKAGLVLSEEDIATGAAAEAWAEALTDEEVNAGPGDYLHNLRAACRTGLVGHRTTGIVGSAVVGYQRAIGKARAKAERPKALDVHIGTVGRRGTFGLPPKVGKKGQPLKSSPDVLSPDPVTLDFVTGYENDFGYTSVLKFRTAEGAILVWKTGDAGGIGRADVGKRYTLAASIKSHGDYKGEKQTILSHVTATEVPDTSTATADVSSDAA